MTPEQIAKELAAVITRLLTQDNRITEHPMFCVQEKKRDTGFSTEFTDGRCWFNSEQQTIVYDDDKEPEDHEGDDWEESGYVDRWETVMVAFTEGGCLEYIRQNGHNHRGELRIYAESFRRCPEMIAIREYFMTKPSSIHSFVNVLDNIEDKQP